ncbi:hypothetical protein KVT40_006029 [Elsinoe batatas]|uniref:Uncharacterized protein n=1 Tax=Elsinoe batatas TaxID=2601811 RepID=A0A8K0L4I2_9PEZI|nr:hypothetical protein KVT40_006029 [Elsinoe batatas]
MLDIGKDTGPVPKCLFSHNLLPRTIDDQQPPTKRKPFSSILDSPFNHTVDVIVPEHDHANFAEKLRRTTGGWRYARVYLKLKDLIEGEFFDQYIKTGNILLLSEGVSGVDNQYSLHDGVLHLELDKATYERAGLVGKPIATPGRKHFKARYAIDLNLRLPSMVRGRSLFNRVVYAFTHALTETKTWLFYDFDNISLDLDARPTKRQKVSGSAESSEAAVLAEQYGTDTSTASAAVVTNSVKTNDDSTESTSPTEEESQPLKAHHPLLLPLEPDVVSLHHTLIPTFPATLSPDDQPEAAELLEWLSLAMLPSPRLQQGDTCDATLSRYSVPDLTSHLARPEPSGSHGFGRNDEVNGPDDRTHEDVDQSNIHHLEMHGTEYRAPNVSMVGDGDGDISMEPGPSSPVLPHSVPIHPDTTIRGNPSHTHQPPRSQTLQKIHYRAFLPSSLVNKMLITLIHFAQKEKTWAALRVQGFGGKKVMVLLPGDGKGAMVWEY